MFITGPSGSGKSSLLNLIGEAVRHRADARLIRFDHLPTPPERPLVDIFGPPQQPPLKHVLRWLSLAGLNDAFVMLRTPGQLSDGQRYRLRLAQTIAMIEQLPTDEHVLPIVLADEFGATLDRLTASVIARNIRKWVRQKSIVFIAATTHDDLLEPFEPDVLIEKPLNASVHIWRRPEAASHD